MGTVDVEHNESVFKICRNDLPKPVHIHIYLLTSNETDKVLTNVQVPGNIRDYILLLARLL